MRKIDKFFTVLFGETEVLIGLVTLISLFETRILWGITKPRSVFLFVFLTSLVSFILGIGILRYKMLARKLLMFFSGYIVLTKIFMFLNLITLSHPFEILIPSRIKNVISFIYHLTIILFFNREEIRDSFK
jgi:spore maturation protein SpmA